ncbi:hypothetical protein CN059_12485 [Sinorhizobium medicae]|nr:hypothetical protein BMJ31_06910 [Sinorhizobium medicae]PLU33197.1 hypothetical protein BMJ26_25695 [Sinorhizobium medicae]PLU38585.1 hypothetical protein BMJ28_12680 [Sinorhizobium medicae]PLU41462.1 hypothetical protein BMJ25_32195 [Sinorhizobium medicae]PLU52315.1 hypothetical protein BMJ24_27525 [Sinorhizobium medicae]
MASKVVANTVERLVIAIPPQQASDCLSSHVCELRIWAKLFRRIGAAAQFSGAVPLNFGGWLNFR